MFQLINMMMMELMIVIFWTRRWWHLGDRPMSDQDWQYWSGIIEFFHEGHKEFYFVTSLQWCRMASWCVTMVDRMVRDRSSTNHKIMFPVLAMASSYAKMAVIQSRPRRAYAGSILSSLKTFQREDVRKIDFRPIDCPHLLDNGGAHCHTRRVPS